ncbi:hypothetical protein [Levilactobacillus suantsaii]|uniref:Uncharacterized protein n=1 Tax=Levilactobacillus suantsaii TaxID=2292255 RepID=A0A4V1LF75_9LACO|nr:hypothetical protein [Levilactobacillus suantsaii]RXI77343.1 hypothetical protein DXH47_09095 [Levilactobacillus suantsaii]
MQWISKKPILSDIQPRVDANTYGKDLKVGFDNDTVFENGDLAIVSGAENFLQTVKTHLMVSNLEYDWGLKEYLPTTTDDQEEFDFNCEELANYLVSDPKIGNTINSLTRLSFDGEVYEVELTADGIDGLATIKFHF